ncbi:twin-arginine translocase subunit TatC [Kingella kingae]|uniref:Sec-independent protein translocase protein TatC n=3 Tax=Kingella kingae TaxID=504 RepID=F5S6A4_KINKI|nr:twin-arginine translocase subunit TatC [Kingella kingae]EGK10583.1 twin arginine-targeting protein translocase TatC [Kingella kingae ATCC 23330]EIC14066.1 putative sec-independent protein translocase component [Kingella kingae PYKK081]MBD3613286.1 twin-arginine translocase subunit TatC [Kingella kingae]MBD3631563.1 twin-arginine translocase subunit TatC [Kingella kingae]MBD3659023.1 twin-arginine translocase subunit TatC [Kingella kingae]
MSEELLPDGGAAQPLMEHLLELRRRLVWAISGIGVCFIAAVPFAQELYAFVAQPLMSVLPQNTSMIATDVVAPFFVPLKVALMVAFLVSLPNTLYQIWAFVAPALYQNEKRLIVPLILSSMTLFALGMAFCYWFVFPIVFKFFAGATPLGVSMATDIGNYLSFVLGMFVAFGMTFEIPVAVVLLYRMGVISFAQLTAARPYLIVAAFVIAAVVTPPDVLSQVMLAIPMILLYEVGLLVCRMIKPREKTENEAEE